MGNLFTGSLLQYNKKSERYDNALLAKQASLNWEEKSCYKIKAGKRETPKKTLSLILKAGKPLYVPVSAGFEEYGRLKRLLINLQERFYVFELAFIGKLTAMKYILLFLA